MPAQPITITRAPWRSTSVAPPRSSAGRSRPRATARPRRARSPGRPRAVLQPQRRSWRWCRAIDARQDRDHAEALAPRRGGQVGALGAAEHRAGQVSRSACRPGSEKQASTTACGGAVLRIRVEVVDQPLAGAVDMRLRSRCRAGRCSSVSQTIRGPPAKRKPCSDRSMCSVTTLGAVGVDDQDHVRSFLLHLVQVGVLLQRELVAGVAVAVGEEPAHRLVAAHVDAQRLRIDQPVAHMQMPNLSDQDAPPVDADVAMQGAFERGGRFEIRGGATATDGAAVRPTASSSLTSGGRSLEQPCICAAMLRRPG